MRIKPRLEQASNGNLIVNGITANMHPYAIEIVSTRLSARWATVLRGRQFSRLCMGPYTPLPAPLRLKRVLDYVAPKPTPAPVKESV
jgi:hypothetical protein